VQKVEHEKTAVHKIGEHIFNGSIAMVGVCLTVIALFSIGKSNVTTYADKILAINAFVFIISSLVSYLSLRSEGASHLHLERYADILFFIGMIIMVFAGLLIVSGF
jgi:hypothetical protein